MAAHRPGKLPEAFRCDGSLENGEIGEVVLRRSVRHAGTRSTGPKRQGFQTIFTQNVQSSLDQSLFQVAVMIFRVAQLLTPK
ncbi:hypothetical protein SIAM614_05246 [Stappia aggregata IAM 12614]|uniref:Uncharacterized protein n=1 Tax=Roseibium aggregatum (strain ATCC 25650 / DSM 13394 / JCM 20685 / NBRC 16684 / NCIMB 2208 / IAM 12614 / B1) TaxID=384765 RepID=A0P394_ROSAI|nr:hypothetical protein SIAM614_05246 [Stappia aggregata IAM 12614] [Roseibium aggregatum IAM 12614]